MKLEKTNSFSHPLLRHNTSTPFCFSPSCPLFFSFSNQSKAQVGYFILFFVLIIDKGYFIIIKLLLLLTCYLTL